MFKLIKPTVSNKKFISKEGLNISTGNDVWLLEEFDIDSKPTNIEVHQKTYDYYEDKCKLVMV